MVILSKRFVFVPINAACGIGIKTKMKFKNEINEG